MVHHLSICKVFKKSLFSRYVRWHSSLKHSCGIRQSVVDSFTSVPFSGNPAAVVFCQKDEQWMHNIAKENNLPVTAFVERLPNEGARENVFSIRWFTPTKEIDLCGHATLAAAHEIFNADILGGDINKITFQSLKGGDLTAKKLSNNAIELDFPSTPPIKTQLCANEVALLTGGLSLNTGDLLFVGRTVSDLIVQVTMEVFVAIPKIVDYKALAALGGRGVVVTSLGAKIAEGTSSGSFRSSDSSYRQALAPQCDFLLRGFFPNIGLNEDFVTGSALCALTPYYWGLFGLPISTKYCEHITVLVAYQASERGGTAKVSMMFNEQSSPRVSIAAQCVTIMNTTILV